MKLIKGEFKMAEFCKECFVNKLLNSKEQKLYKEGKIEIVESIDNDYCEGCGKIVPVVIEATKERGAK